MQEWVVERVSARVDGGEANARESGGEGDCKSGRWRG